MKKFKVAFRGIALALKDGNSLKLQFAGMFIALAMGFYFQLSVTDWCFIILSIGLVIGAEIMNTAIEWLCDFVEPNYSTKIGRIKDVAAGAVLVTAITAFVIGAIIFVPKISGIINFEF